jgi:flagellar protein FlaG
MKIDSSLSALDYAAVQSPVHSERPAESRELIRAVQAINEAELFGAGSELTFSPDRYTQRTVLKIVDRKTKEVLRQIPAERVLRLANELKRNKDGVA